MKGLFIKKITVEADVNISADDWQLYHIPGADKAAHELNQAVKSALKIASCKAEARDLVWKKMFELSDFGAEDSEPGWVLDLILNEVYGAER